MSTAPEKASLHDGDALLETGTAQEEPLEIAVTYTSKTFTIQLAPQTTISDLVLLCESELRSRYAPEDETEYTVTKLLAPPPAGLIQVAKDGEKTVADVFGTAGTAGTRKLKLRVLASPTKVVDALRQTSEAMKKREARIAELRRSMRARIAAPPRVGSAGSSEFTFADIRPLAHLPHPERSLAILHRLRDDVGIRHVMAAHRFRVGLLTEMDPLLYTESNHEGTSRTLGLNRNRGEVIELRLRTDAGDGYRDYKTVRRTLCHELAHNVHGPHDQNFWTLCHQLEREVERADYHASGRTLSGYGDGDFYQPSTSHTEHDYDEHVDAGGWTGGTFVLGSGQAPSPAAAATEAAATLTAAATEHTDAPPASQREQRARAAEERLRKTGEGGDDASSQQTGGGSDPNPQ